MSRGPGHMANTVPKAMNAGAHQSRDRSMPPLSRDRYSGLFRDDRDDARSMRSFYSEDARGQVD